MKITVRRKVMSGLFVIFSISVLILNIFMSEAFEKDAEKKIIKDMGNVYITSREYAKQLFLVNNIDFTESAFVKNGSIIVKGLGKANNCCTTIYSTIGKNPYQYIPAGSNIPREKRDEGNEKLIKEAINNKSAVKIDKIEKLYIADFAFPLYINDTYLGIIRFTFDYTDVYTANRSFRNMLMFFVVIIFLSIFVFSYLLTYKVTKPLTRLSSAFYGVAGGNYSECIERKSNDEIGDLTDNFNYMINKIREQIETIEEEKRKVMELEKARTEFFNNVTHELKTPLTAISGYAQLLEGGVEDKEFYDRAISRIQSESNRLHRMVVELIEMSKNSYKSKLKLERLNLADVVKVIAKDMTFKAEKYNVKIKTETEDVFVNGDICKISEVVINLVDNAIKYGYSNNDVILRAYNEKSFGMIEIENRGEEIPDNIKDKIFEPFFRAESTAFMDKDSSGLGLYICKNIIQQHSGTISISSKDDIIVVSIKIPLIK